MCHGPLRSITCSTRPTRSPPPFLPSLARTPACLPTDRRYSLLPSSSHRSPDVLHSLNSLSLTFSLSLALTRACPPTDRPNDVTTASLLAPSEVSSSFPTCFIRLTHASTVSALALPQVGVCTVHFPEPQATFLSHRATYGATATNTTSSFIDQPSPAFCPYILSRFERRFPVGFQPSRVTGLQATSPQRSLPQLTVVYVAPFLARIFSFSALESRSLRPYAGVSADQPS